MPADRIATVGFDLDMTLVDTAAGIVDTQHAVLCARGVALDRTVLVAEVGVPVETLFARWLPACDVDDAVAAYRARYAEEGPDRVFAMPGAADALADLRRRGVVSAKPAEIIHLVLEQVGLTVDVVVGGLFAEGKAAGLREHGVQVYVGDHPGDVSGAREAKARALAVTTGLIRRGTAAGRGSRCRARRPHRALRVARPGLSHHSHSDYWAQTEVDPERRRCPTHLLHGQPPLPAP